MALRGDLGSVDLAQVFQMLALNKKVGLLSIQSSEERHVLYFDERGVTVCHNAHRLLDTAVARLEAVNPELNAVVIPMFDSARKEIGAGLPDGPLRGARVPRPRLVRAHHWRRAALPLRRESKTAVLLIRPKQTGAIRARARSTR